jgi:hypothetical protein
MANPKKDVPVREGLDGTDRPAAPTGPGLAGAEDPPNKKKRKYVRKGQSKFREQLAPHTPPPVPPPRVLDLDPTGLAAEAEGTTEKEILNTLFSDAFKRYTKRQEADKGVEAIADVVSRIQSGAPMKELESTLTPLLSGQSSKTTILQAVMFNHMMELVALHWDMRWHLMRELWADLRMQKLKPLEKLALLKIADQCADKAAAYINEQNPTFTPMTEIDATMERASKHSADQEKRARSKDMEGTTPQGREIVRRLTFKATQAADKIVSGSLKNTPEPPKPAPESK